MSMISRFRSVPLTIAPEPQAEVNDVQQPKLPEPSMGIATSTDAFESADPLKTGIFSLIQQQPFGDGQMLQSEPTVDASILFDYLADPQEPQPPVPPEPPEQMLSLASGISAKNSEAIDETVSDVMQFAEDVPNRALDAGVDAFVAVADVLSDAGDIADDVVDELAKPVGDVMYGDTVDDVVDFVSTEIVDRGLNGLREIGLKDEADWIEKTGGDTIEFAGDALHETGEAAEDVLDFFGDAASDAGDFAEDVLDTVAAPAYDVVWGDAIDDVIAAGEDGIDAIGDAVGDAADAAGDVIDDIGDAAEDGLDAIGDAAGDVGDWLDDLDWP